MTVRPIIFSGPMVRALLEGRKTQTRRLATSPLRNCAVGDLLYVRESHYVQSAGYKDCSGKLILFRATTPDAPTTWTPSIHMPRWASRLTLQVTERRLQRLADITDADAIAEGIYSRQSELGEVYSYDVPGEVGAGARTSITVRPAGYQKAHHAFIGLWERLHGSGSWVENREVVALTFTVHKANVDALLEQRKAA